MPNESSLPPRPRRRLQTIVVVAVGIALLGSWRWNGAPWLPLWVLGWTGVLAALALRLAGAARPSRVSAPGLDTESARPARGPHGGEVDDDGLSELSGEALYRLARDRSGGWRLQWASRALERVIGLDPATGPSPDLARLALAEDAPEVEQLRTAAAEDGRERQFRYRIELADGRVRWIEDRFRVVPADGAETTSLLIGVVRDVTRDQELIERLSQTDLFDEETGLPNRRLLLDRLRQARVRSDRGTRSIYAVIALELDPLEASSDSIAHRAAEVLLCHLASVLRENVRSADTVARVASHQIVVLLTDLDSEQGALEVAARCSDLLAAELEKETAAAVPSRLGLGVAVGRSDDRAAEDALHRAESACTRSLNDDGELVVWDAQLAGQARTRLRARRELRGALEQGQFLLRLQPVIRLRDGALVGFEGLVRWQHPTRGEIAPGDFLDLLATPEAERRFTDRVLAMVTEQAALWRERYPRLGPLVFTSNVRPRIFLRPGLVESVRESLDASGLDPEALHLEITEDALLQPTDRVLESLRALRETGVSIGLDNFGRGYSSLGYLRHFSFDTVKIDRSFVAALDEPRTQAVVAAVVELARRLGIHVTAQGVEHAWQVEVLQKLHCEWAQGFLLGHPETADVLEKTMGHWQPLGREDDDPSHTQELQVIRPFRSPRSS